MTLDPSDYSVGISADRMEATLTLLNEDPESPPSYEDLRAALESNKVRQGIAEDRLKELAEKPVYKVPHLVARGTPSQDGENEQVTYHFPTTDEVQLKVSESGAVDFRSIGNFNNTESGALLAEKAPATEGVPGVNVLGEALKARDGKKVPLRVGKGAELSEDEMRAVATAQGHACLVGGRITVLNTVEVPGHVDYSVGNISFIGSVVIRGGVMPGFTVEAQGDIGIAHNVEKAHIKCGGNLDLRGIVFGQGDSTIQVGGDAQIGALDQAQVQVQGNLTVNSYIRHSQVAVGGLVQVTGQKGTIVGGGVAAFQGITVPYVGNSMATLTKLTVGTNPFISQDLETLKAQLHEVEKKLEQVSHALKAAQDKQVAAGKAGPQTEQLIGKLEKLRNQLQPAQAQLKKQLAETEGHRADYKEARIRVGEIIYPGVILNFRDRLQYKTLDEAQHVTFYEEEAEICTGAY